MKKIFAYSTVFLLAACSTVSLTGRKRLPLLPAGQMQSMSYSQYDQVMKDSPKSSNAQWTKWGKDCGNKIRLAVEQDKNRRNEAKDLEGYAWEFNLLEEANTVNAWCMPGGKIVFYTGILELATTDDEIAVIMGHEIAHAVAGHGNERMSQAAALQGVTSAAQFALMNDSTPGIGNAVLMQSIGIGGQLGMLKFGRKHESESDEMGLIFMNKAGYNPYAAVTFWEAMKANSGGQSPPEFMSTHPSDEKRIADIKAYLPEAKKYVNK